MVLNAIGGVRVRGLRHLPRFLWLAQKARKAALASEGCLAVDLFREGWLFFALSVWTDAQAMRAYAHHGVHRTMMQDTPALCDFFHNITCETEKALTPDEASNAWREAWPGLG